MLRDCSIATLGYHRNPGFGEGVGTWFKWIDSSGGASGLGGLRIPQASCHSFMEADTARQGHDLTPSEVKVKMSKGGLYRDQLLSGREQVRFCDRGARGPCLRRREYAG